MHTHIQNNGIISLTFTEKPDMKYKIQKQTKSKIVHFIFHLFIRKIRKKITMAPMGKI